MSSALTLLLLSLLLLLLFSKHATVSFVKEIRTSLRGKAVPQSPAVGASVKKKFLSSQHDTLASNGRGEKENGIRETEDANFRGFFNNYYK